jgi:hypothetical protein
VRLWIMVVQERHIVRASQDAAVSGLGQEDHLPVQAGERRGWRVLAAEFPVNETVNSWCAARPDIRDIGGRRPGLPRPRSGQGVRPLPAGNVLVEILPCARPRVNWPSDNSGMVAALR